MASCLFCCFLLQLLFGAVLTGTVMFALSGMCFPLFSNLTFHELMTLYRNGNEDYVMIARWENATFTSKYLNPNYTGKIFLEINKTLVIRMCNLDQTHSAKYLVQYGINTAGPEVELTIMENKQLDVCLNNPPNSSEKCFGNLTEDEFQNWLDNHPGFMKKYFGNLTVEQIGQEIRKFLDDYTEHIKEYLGNLTGEQIGQIRKLLDNTEHIKEHLGNLTGEQIGQIRKLLDNTEHIKEHLGSHDSLMIGLLLSILAIMVSAIIAVWIDKKFCSEPKQSSKSHYKHKAVPTGGSGETISMFPKLSKTVRMETAQSNETNVGNVF